MYSVLGTKSARQCFLFLKNAQVPMVSFPFKSRAKIFNQHRQIFTFHKCIIFKTPFLKNSLLKRRFFNTQNVQNNTATLSSESATSNYLTSYQQNFLKFRRFLKTLVLLLACVPLPIVLLICNIGWVGKQLRKYTKRCDEAVVLCGLAMMNYLPLASKSLINNGWIDYMFEKIEDLPQTLNYTIDTNSNSENNLPNKENTEISLKNNTSSISAFNLKFDEYIDLSRLELNAEFLDNLCVDKPNIIRLKFQSIKPLPSQSFSETSSKDTNDNTSQTSLTVPLTYKQSEDNQSNMYQAILPPSSLPSSFLMQSNKSSESNSRYANSIIIEFLKQIKEDESNVVLLKEESLRGEFNQSENLKLYGYQKINEEKRQQSQMFSCQFLMMMASNPLMRLELLTMDHTYSQKLRSNSNENRTESPFLDLVRDLRRSFFSKISSIVSSSPEQIEVEQPGTSVPEKKETDFNIERDFLKRLYTSIALHNNAEISVAGANILYGLAKDYKQKRLLVESGGFDIMCRMACAKNPSVASFATLPISALINGYPDIESQSIPDKQRDIAVQSIVNLSHNLMQSGNQKDALIGLQDCSKLNPNDISVMHSLVLVYTQLNMFKEASEMSRRLLKRSPTANQDLTFMLAQNLCNNSSSIDDKEEAARSLIGLVETGSVNHNYEQVYGLLVDVLETLGRPEEAIDYMKRFSNSDEGRPLQKSHLNYAKLLIKHCALSNLTSLPNKRLIEASKALKYACELQPFNSETFLLLAKCQFRLGLFQEALQSSENLLKLKPNCVDGLNLLGQIYKSMRNQEEMELVYKRIEAIQHKQSAKKVLPNVYYQRGIAQEHQNKFEQAYLSFSSALESQNRTCSSSNYSCSNWFKRHPNDNISLEKIAQRFHALDNGSNDTLNINETVISKLRSNFEKLEKLRVESGIN